MKPRVLLHDKGTRKPFLRSPDFTSADHPWAGFLFEESYSRNEPIKRAAFAKTTIFLCTQDGGTAHRRHRGVSEQHRVAPGHVFIARKDVEIEEAWTSNPWPTMILQIDGAPLRELAGGKINAIERGLVSAVTKADERLAALMMTMRSEVKAGCPSGRIYGESMSLALLAYIVGSYSQDQKQEEAPRSRLPRHQVRRIAEYVSANLTEDIAVTDLASLVNMSPSHFARVFKISFGQSPYQFVMEQRIQAAKAMLAGGRLSSSEVAQVFNFASQSHFAKVFRQFTGVTPTQYKAGL